jgi:hypothetical protein
MAPVKEGRFGKPALLLRSAPVRTLASSVGERWSLSEEEVRDELTLLERVQGICRDYGKRCFSQVVIDSYQDVPPGAVSLIDPPDRAWLVRLQLHEQAWDQSPGKVEIIVALWDGEADIIPR